MLNYTLILFEKGIDLNITHYGEWRASSLPFWGDFTCLDFFLTQLNTGEECKKVLVVEEENREIHSLYQRSWQDKNYPQTYPLSDLERLIGLLEAQNTSHVVLTALSYIPLIDKAALAEKLQKTEDKIIKLAIDGTPVDLYLAPRTGLLTELRSALNRAVWQKDLIDFLFTHILPAACGSQEDIGGYILFRNQLRDIYKEHLQLLHKLDNAWLTKGIDDLLKLGFAREISAITKDGHVKSSILSSKVRIEGYVENSFIFPGVTVEKKARVINSVVMNNNHIGKNTIIQNTLILPYTRDLMKGNANLEDKTCIGGTSLQVKNNQYPEQIFDGLTVLGINVDLPRGFTVEQGCFLEGDIPPAILKKMLKIKKGQSLFKSEVETS